MIHYSASNSSASIAGETDEMRNQFNADVCVDPRYFVRSSAAGRSLLLLLLLFLDVVRSVVRQIMSSALGVLESCVRDKEKLRPGLDLV